MRFKNDPEKAREARLYEEGFGPARFPDSSRKAHIMLYGENAPGNLNYERLAELLDSGNEFVPITSITPNPTTDDGHIWLARVTIVKGTIEYAVLFPRMAYPDRVSGSKTDRFLAIYVKSATSSIEGTLASETGRQLSSYIEQRALEMQLVS